MTTVAAGNPQQVKAESGVAVDCFAGELSAFEGVNVMPRAKLAFRTMRGGVVWLVPFHVCLLFKTS